VKKILVVEDSPTVQLIIRRTIDLESDLTALYARSLREAKELVEQHRNDIFAALVDLGLPDATRGEMVDYSLELQIPTVVLTGNMDDAVRKQLQEKGVVDYVNKEGLFAFRYCVRLLNRLWRNQAIKVLVTDDSAMARRYVARLLTLYQFQVFQASDGLEALDVLHTHPDIKLLITDYNMPRMDGFELVQKLRDDLQRTGLGIIGLSSGEKENLSARFIKYGADDFLRKPFNQEEFQCRVLHNIEALENIEQIRNIADRDYLTGAYNRRYFFENASALYNQAREEGTELAAAVIDIDFFKLVNDNYGHDIGDGVLKYFAKTLHESLEKCLVARAGGEEFFILMPGLNNHKACQLIDAVRAMMTAKPLVVDDQQLPISFSAGVSNQLLSSLDAQIKQADQLLYQAKELGRNRVVGESYLAIEKKPATGSGHKVSHTR